MPGSNRRSSPFASQRTRVTAVTGDQTVKATPALLHRLIASNGDAAAQTVTLKDGAATLGTWKWAAGQTLEIALYMQMGTSLIVNPSSANLDILALYD